MDSNLFTSRASRIFAAIIGVLVTSTILTAAMPAYLPFAQGDTIAGPILLFPLTWVALFLFSLITTNIWRVWGMLGLLSLSHALIIYFALTAS